MTQRPLAAVVASLPFAFLTAAALADALRSAEPLLAVPIVYAVPAACAQIVIAVLCWLLILEAQARWRLHGLYADMATGVAAGLLIAWVESRAGLALALPPWRFVTFGIVGLLGGILARCVDPSSSPSAADRMVVPTSTMSLLICGVLFVPGSTLWQLAIVFVRLNVGYDREMILDLVARSLEMLTSIFAPILIIQGLICTLLVHGVLRLARLDRPLHYALAGFIAGLVLSGRMFASEFLNAATFPLPAFSAAIGFAGLMSVYRFAVGARGDTSDHPSAPLAARDVRGLAPVTAADARQISTRRVFGRRTAL